MATTFQVGDRVQTLAVRTIKEKIHRAQFIKGGDTGPHFPTEMHKLAGRQGTVSAVLASGTRLLLQLDGGPQTGYVWNSSWVKRIAKPKAIPPTSAFDTEKTTDKLVAWKFEPQQYVRIKTDVVDDGQSPFFTSDMESLKGTVVPISEVRADGCGRLNREGGWYAVRPEWVESVELGVGDLVTVDPNFKHIDMEDRGINPGAVTTMVDWVKTNPGKVMKVESINGSGTVNLRSPDKVGAPIDLFSWSPHWLIKVTQQEKSSLKSRKVRIDSKFIKSIPKDLLESRPYTQGALLNLMLQATPVVDDKGHAWHEVDSELVEPFLSNKVGTPGREICDSWKARIRKNVEGLGRKKVEWITCEGGSTMRFHGGVDIVRHIRVVEDTSGLGRTVDQVYKETVGNGIYVPDKYRVVVHPAEGESSVIEIVEA